MSLFTVRINQLLLATVLMTAWLTCCASTDDQLPGAFQWHTGSSTTWHDSMGGAVSEACAAAYATNNTNGGCGNPGHYTVTGCGAENNRKELRSGGVAVVADIGFDIDELSGCTGQHNSHNTSSNEIEGLANAGGTPPDESEPKDCTTPHPVQFARGEKHYDYVDYRSESEFPLQVNRSYRVTVDPLQQKVWYAWYFSYRQSLIVTSGWVAALREDGGFQKFTYSSSYVATSGNPKNSLTTQGSSTSQTWTYTLSDGTVETYDYRGLLTHITNPRGIGQTIVNTLDGNGAVSNVEITQDVTGQYIDLVISNDQINTLQVNGSDYISYTWQEHAQDILATVTYPNNYRLRYEYDSGKNQGIAGLVTGIFESPDNGTTETRYSNVVYDSLGRVTTSELMDGTTAVESLTFSYDWDNDNNYADGDDWSNLASVTVARTKVTNSDGLETIYTFDANGDLSSGTNGDLLDTRDWKLVSVEGADFGSCQATTAETKYEQKPSGSTKYMPTVKLDKNGAITSYAYDTKNRITEVITGQSGTTSSYSLAAASQKVETTGYEGDTTLPTQKKYYGRNSGNSAWVQYRQEDFTYDDGTNTCSDASTPTNRVCTRTVTDEINSVSRTWTYAYTYTSDVLTGMTVDGPLSGSGDTTTYTYSAGNIASIEDAAGHTTDYADYNAFGLPETITDPNSIVTTIDYDDNTGKVNDVIGDSAGIAAETDYSYYANGLLDTVTSADGSTAQYIYNSAHQLTHLINNFGEHIDLTPSALDGKWTLAKTYQASGTSSGDLTLQQGREFDALGRLWKQKDASDDEKNILGYDANNNLTNVIAIGDTTHANRVSYKTYDAQNRISSEIHCTDTDSPPTVPEYCSSGKLVTTNYGYDGQGNINSVVVKNASNTTISETDYSYNGFGELTEQDSPDSGTTTYTYDAAGRLSSKTDANSVTTHYSYDNIGRLTAKYFGSAPTIGCSQLNVTGTQDVLYIYDQSSHGDSAGRLTCVVSKSGVKNYTYDALGRITTKTVTPAVGSIGSTLSTSYTYNNVGALTQITYPHTGGGGRTVTYTRNSGNSRLSLIKVQYNGSDDFSSADSGAAMDSFAYQPFGGVSRFQRNTETGDYFTTEKTYNADGLLSAINQSVSTGGSIDLSYDYDVFNNISAISNSNAPEANQGFEYDALNRLTQATGPYGKYIYQYDAIGNRTHAELDHIPDITAPTTYSKVFDETYSYNSGTNQLNSILRADGSSTTMRTRSFKYDSNGNRTGDRKTIYESNGTTVHSDITIVPAYGNGNRMDSVGWTDCMIHSSYTECL